MTQTGGRDPAVGDEARQEVLVDAALVRRFAEAVGDLNPLHADAAFAARTRFGRPIAHGTLFVGILGKLMGMDLPGTGTVYLEHQLRFLRPVYVGDRATAAVRIVEVLPKQRYRLSTQVLDSEDRVCIDGTALVWHPKAMP